VPPQLLFQCPGGQCPGMMMRTVTLSTFLTLAAGHGAVRPASLPAQKSLPSLPVPSSLFPLRARCSQVVNPPPRNAIDKDIAPWNGPVPCHVAGKCPSVETETGWCPVPDKDGKASGQNGQSCFWVRPDCRDTVSRIPCMASRLHLTASCVRPTAGA
jgi:hypothetical protein